MALKVNQGALSNPPPHTHTYTTHTHTHTHTRTYAHTHTHTHTHTQHTHTDRLTGVAFILPDQYYNISAIPAEVPLLFHSTLSTQYNTTIYGTVHYGWDFGDGTKTNDPAVLHTYTQSGYFQLTLTVHGFSSTVRNITTLRVYQRESLTSLMCLPA